MSPALPALAIPQASHTRPPGPLTCVGEQSYTPLKNIGDGSFGTVWLVDYHSPLPGNVQVRPPGAAARQKFPHSKCTVALKRMKRTYDSWNACLELAELRSLVSIPRHENIINLYDAFLHPGTKQLHFVFEFMEGNLYQLSKRKEDHKQSFSGGLIAQIFSQMLAGLDHIHSSGYFHRDMKPENVLITLEGPVYYPPSSPFYAPPGSRVEADQKVTVKIADFGLARELKSKPPYTEYVSTRWYRAPEVILHDRYYSGPVDMWALGTMLMEMLELKPLFPGTNEIEQLIRICEVLGDPSEEYGFDSRGCRRGGGSWVHGVKMGKEFGFSFPKIVPQDIHSRFDYRVVPPELIDLISDLLVYEPQNRLTSKQCLEHPYFRDIFPRLQPLDLPRNPTQPPTPSSGSGNYNYPSQPVIPAPPQNQIASPPQSPGSMVLDPPPNNGVSVSSHNQPPNLAYNNNNKLQSISPSASSHQDSLDTSLPLAPSGSLERHVSIAGSVLSVPESVVSHNSVPEFSSSNAGGRYHIQIPTHQPQQQQQQPQIQRRSSSVFESNSNGYGEGYPESVGHENGAGTTAVGGEGLPSSSSFEQTSSSSVYQNQNIALNPDFHLNSSDPRQYHHPHQKPAMIFHQPYRSTSSIDSSQHPSTADSNNINNGITTTTNANTNLNNNRQSMASTYYDSSLAEGAGGISPSQTSVLSLPAMHYPNDSSSTTAPTPQMSQLHINDPQQTTQQQSQQHHYPQNQHPGHSHINQSIASTSSASHASSSQYPSRNTSNAYLLPQNQSSQQHQASLAGKTTKDWSFANHAVLNPLNVPVNNNQFHFASLSSTSNLQRSASEKSGAAVGGVAPTGAIGGRHAQPPQQQQQSQQQQQPPPPTQEPSKPLTKKERKRQQIEAEKQKREAVGLRQKERARMVLEKSRNMRPELSAFNSFFEPQQPPPENGNNPNNKASSGLAGAISSSTNVNGHESSAGVSRTGGGGGSKYKNKGGVGFAFGRMGPSLTDTYLPQISEKPGGGVVPPALSQTMTNTTNSNAMDDGGPGVGGGIGGIATGGVRRFLGDGARYITKTLRREEDSDAASAISGNTNRSRESVDAMRNSFASAASASGMIGGGVSGIDFPGEASGRASISTYSSHLSDSVVIAPQPNSKLHHLHHFPLPPNHQQNPSGGIASGQSSSSISSSTAEFVGPGGVVHHHYHSEPSQPPAHSISSAHDLNLLKQQQQQQQGGR